MNIAVWLTLAAAAVLVILITLPLSFQSVNYDEVGITMFVPSHSVSDEVLPTGRYFLVIPTRLFRYKANVRPRKYDLHCITTDGIAIELTTKLQIQLLTNETLNAFFELGDEEKLDQFSTVVARETFRDSCSKFILNDFFQNRVTVQNHMMQLLAIRLKEANAHVVVLKVQLLNIEVPEDVLRSIKAAEVARQDIEKARRERIQVLIMANTTVLSAIKKNKAILIDAAARAEGIKQAAEQEALGWTAHWDARSKAYVAVKQAMQVNNTILLNSYVKTRTLQTHPNALVALE